MPDLTPYRYSHQALRYLRSCSDDDAAAVAETIALVNTGDDRLLAFPSPLRPEVMVALMPNGHVLAWRVHPEFRMLYEVLFIGSGAF